MDLGLIIDEPNMDLITRMGKREAPVVHHGRGVGPVLGGGLVLDSVEAGVRLEAELGDELGARVDARVQAVSAVVVVMAVAPARIARVDAPPGSARGCEFTNLAAVLIMWTSRE